MIESTHLSQFVGANARDVKTAARGSFSSPAHLQEVLVLLGMQDAGGVVDDGCVEHAVTCDKVHHVHASSAKVRLLVPPTPSG